MLRQGFLAGAVIAAVAASAAHAESFIVYGCGDPPTELCRMSPDGSGSVRLTHDGGSDPTGPADYGTAELSRDGSRLAFTQGRELFVSDAALQGRSGPLADNVVNAAMRPDGAEVAVLVASGFRGLDLHVLPADGSRTASEATLVRSGANVGGWFGNELVTDRQHGIRDAGGTILCVWSGGACARDLLIEPTGKVRGMTTSPDLRRIAVTVEQTGGETAVAVHDLTGGPRLDLPIPSASPTFSPGGTRLAFDGQYRPGISVTGFGGGSPSRIASGLGPSWGGTPEAPASRPILSALRVTPSAFRPGPAKAATIRYRLSAAATVAFVLEQRSGRGWKIAKPFGAFSDSGSAGANSLPYSGRAMDAGRPLRKLPPGRYRLNARAFDEEGNAGRAVRAPFRVKR